MTSVRLLQAIAISIAVSALALQIVFGVEYLGPSATTPTLFAMALVLISMAILPKLCALAIKAHRWWLAVMLTVTFAAGLLHSLPATVGRTAELKETKVVTAETVAKKTAEAEKLLDDELQRARDRLKDAQDFTTRKCKWTAYSGNCAEAKRTEAEKQSRVDALVSNVVALNLEAADNAAIKINLGDTGSEFLAKGLQLMGYKADAGTIRLVSVIGFGLWLDLIIWVLLEFGTSTQLAAKLSMAAQAPVTSQAVPFAINTIRSFTGIAHPGVRDGAAMDANAAFADLCCEVSAGRFHGVIAYGNRWRCTKGEASKRLSGWEQTKLIRTEKHGKLKLVTDIQQPELKSAA